MPDVLLKQLCVSSNIDMTEPAQNVQLWQVDIDCIPAILAFQCNGSQWVDKFPVISIGSNPNMDNFVKCVDFSDLNSVNQIKILKNGTYPFLANGDELYFRKLAFPNLTKIGDPNQPTNYQISFRLFGFEA